MTTLALISVGLIVFDVFISPLDSPLIKITAKVTVGIGVVLFKIVKVGAGGGLIFTVGEFQCIV